MTYNENKITDLDYLRAENIALHQENTILRTLNQLISDFTYAFYVTPDGSLSLEWIEGNFTEITGYTVAEVQKLGWWVSLIHPEEQDLIRRRIDRLLNNQTSVCEFRIQTRAGEVRWLRDHARPVQDELETRVTHIIGAAQDITAQHLADETLQRERDFARRLMEATQAIEDELHLQAMLMDQIEDYIIITDLEGRIKYVNQAAAQASHADREQLIGELGCNLETMLRAGITRPEVLQETLDNGTWRGTLASYNENQEQIFLESRTWVVYDQHRAPQGIVGISRDITEQRRVEAERERLLIAEREHRLLAEILAEITLALTSQISHEAVLDEILSQTQRIVHFTTAHIMLLKNNTLRVGRWQGYTAYNADALLANLEQPLEKFPIDTEVVRTRTPAVIYDTRQDSRWVVMEETAWVRSCLMVPICLRDRALGLLRLDSDMPNQFTEVDAQRLKPLSNAAAIAIENARLYAQEQARAATLARTLEQQRQFDRIQNEFIQNVSHELRTPLAIAWGYVQLLADGDLGELQPEQQKTVAIIVRRLGELTKLVEDINTILDLETQEETQQLVDMAVLVRSALTTFRATAREAGLTLIDYLVPGLPRVMGDMINLRRMVDNLLSNACKFTPAGGQVRVSLTREYQFIRLEINDTGIGIPEEELERIFDRFYQVDGSPTRSYGGTGLGLALAKEIVIAHGGMVDVQSTVGKGSAFIVRLPIYRQP
ncbi:MAG: PAS domain S-box protein [Anaerolineae bacterium]|nr:PAS domain S-box protein [Anaerolineae bacterium]